MAEPGKYAILEINGGIGKSIMATAVCQAIKKQYPDRKLLVVSAWVEPLVNCPYIDRVYKAGSTPYFYEDFVDGSDTLFLCQEPYRSNGYLTESQHLIEAWCECIGVKYNGELPSLSLTQREEQQTINSFIRQKPIMVIQPFGGLNKKTPYAWNRDLPPQQAQALVDVFSQQFHIMQIGTQDQPKLNNVEFLTLPLRDAMEVINISSARIFIDSFGQHAAAALGKPSVVCWITNKPKVFGYGMHINVNANWNNTNKNIHHIDGYFQKFDFGGGRLYDFPFKDHNVFDIKQIVEAVQAIQTIQSKSLPKK